MLKSLLGRFSGAGNGVSIEVQDYLCDDELS